MINLLQKSNFATKNNFENVASKDHLNFILKNYVECINKEPEEIGKSFFTPASLYAAIKDIHAYIIFWCNIM